MSTKSPRPLLISDFPHILHGGDYNPDQWLHAPNILKQDLELIEDSGCNLFSLGIFSWSQYEPEDNKYQFDWLDDILEKLLQKNCRVLLATPTGSKPPWMSKKYPEIRRVNRDGLREPHRWRHNHCWSSPIFKDKVQAINERLSERYYSHPVLGGWHISNEYSGTCYCNLCLKSWQNWLEEKYGSLKALNEAWWTGFWSHKYTNFDEIDPRDESIDGLQLDFLRFNTQQVIDFYNFEKAAIRKHSQNIPCTTNFMGLIPDLNYAAIAEHVDYVADDQYPGYHADKPDLMRCAAGVSMKNDLFRSFKPMQPWLVMESCPEAPQWHVPSRIKGPGIHEIEMYQALGHGAEGTCYFQWRKGRGGFEKLHGAVVDHAGTNKTRTFKTIKKLSHEYKKLSSILGSKNVSEVALVYDWEVRWAFEITGGLRNKDAAYVQVATDHYLPLWQEGLNVDVLSSERDFSLYKLVIAPQLWMLKPGVAEAIKKYVFNGGTFVATYYLGGVDEHNRCWLGGFPGNGLREVFGIYNEEFDWLPYQEKRTTEILTSLSNFLPDFEIDKAVYGTEVAAILQLQGATSLINYAQDFYNGSPALTVNRYGQGQAYYIATNLGSTFLKKFYDSLVAKLEISKALLVPDGVSMQRRQSDTHEYIFLQNFTKSRQSLDLEYEYYDMLGEKNITQKLHMDPLSHKILSRQMT